MQIFWRKFLILLALTKLLTGPNAYAEDSFKLLPGKKDEAPILKADMDDGTHFMIPLQKISAGTKFYHWTSYPNEIENWPKKGVSDSEINWLLEKGEGLQGGGVYVSSDSVDSSHFGKAVIVFTPKNDLIYLKAEDRAILETHMPHLIGRNILNTNLAKVGVDGSTNGDTWFVFTSKKALGKLHMGTYDEVMQGWSHEKTFDKLLQIEYSLGEIKPHPILAQEFPEIERLLEGKKLSEADLKKLKQLVNDFGDDRDVRIPISKLFSQIKKALIPEANEQNQDPNAPAKPELNHQVDTPSS